ncbi:MAG: peptidyl-prolyl cis-trans isomerase [Sedimentisphaerales bacterium]|nr:peptidyl-prolyl cis-trans isomerase [Sedimentisphaerales bacterium]
MTDQKPQETPKNSNLVKLQTSKGDIVIELNEEKAPITVKNFVDYVKDGYYDGLIFHRVIKGFMIQGGGFDANMKQKVTKTPIINEGNNGLRNQRGAIAMARTNNPDSATSQFYICDKDNDFLNYAPGRPGYAVFGKVIEGMETVDAIAAVKTGIKAGMQDVPIEPVIIISAKMVSDQ